MRSTSHTLKLAATAALAATLGAWWAGCNQHPVEYSSGSAAIEHERDLPATNESQLDLLWVVDNSGSMCDQQAELRKNFGEFLGDVSEKPIDFNMAVTTTQIEDAFYEEIARAGHIQSTPHPPVGSNEACQCANPDPESDDTECLEPEQGQFGEDAKYTGKFAPTRQQIEAAVKCTAGYTDDPEQFPEELTEIYDPEQDRVAWSDDEMACAIEGENCSEAGKGDDFEPIHLFPCGHLEGQQCEREQLEEVYRDIPKVLSAEDYTNEDGALDLEAFQRDFQCMSYVGTRGSGNEEGLRSAARTVHPRMTGGTPSEPIEDPSSVQDDDENWSYPDGDPTQAPNHGFLRKEANTAVIFITDENDCSHRQESAQFLAEKYGCSDLNCYYAAEETRNPPDGQDQPPLVPTDQLADRFMNNLAATKQVDEISQDEVVMASIHGFARPSLISGEDGIGIQTDCSREQNNELFGELEVCQTFGTAYSGDRYEDFLLNFERIIPERGTGSGEAELTGEMCSLDGFSNALGGLAEEVEGGARTCIDKYVPCSDSSECPEFVYGGGDTCPEWPGGTGDNYCKSAMQVRLSYTGDGEAETQLDNLGICYSDSIGSEQTPDGCVVDRDAYSWGECPGSDRAVSLSWDSDDLSSPSRQLSDFQTRLRYTELTGDDSSAGGADAGAAGADGG